MVRGGNASPSLHRNSHPISPWEILRIELDLIEDDLRRPQAHPRRCRRPVTMQSCILPYNLCLRLMKPFCGPFVKKGNVIAAVPQCGVDSWCFCRAASFFSVVQRYRFEGRLSALEQRRTPGSRDSSDYHETMYQHGGTVKNLPPQFSPGGQFSLLTQTQYGFTPKTVELGFYFASVAMSECTRPTWGLHRGATGRLTAPARRRGAGCSRQAVGWRVRL